ncbi:MAG TPA: DUF2279 domain-containing protein [Burkholderiales bacterium]|nr:DUF2279 domain-containing protein [Burkholderiales bacterium]
MRCALRGTLAAIALAGALAAPAAAADVSERNGLIIGGGALAVFAYGKAKWWSEGFSGDFRSRKEGWFGSETYAGGADKLGHAWGTYVGTRALARTFEWAGNDEGAALRLAAWSALGTYMAIEVLDGYSRRWTFSREDALANAAGAGIAVLLERDPALDRLVDLRLLYTPPRRSSDSRTIDPLSDYTGQTYLLVVKAAGVPALRDRPVWRYLEVAAGYGARRFDDGPDARPGRTRNLYLGISLNLSEVLARTAGRDEAPPGWGRRLASGVLEVVQVPGTFVPLARHHASP